MSAIEADTPAAATPDLDSAAFAQIWNEGRAARKGTSPISAAHRALPPQV